MFFVISSTAVQKFAFALLLSSIGGRLPDTSITGTGVPEKAKENNAAVYARVSVPCITITPA